MDSNSPMLRLDIQNNDGSLSDRKKRHRDGKRKHKSTRVKGSVLSPRDEINTLVSKQQVIGRELRQLTEDQLSTWSEMDSLRVEIQELKDSNLQELQLIISELSNQTENINNHRFATSTELELLFKTQTATTEDQKNLSKEFTNIQTNVINIQNQMLNIEKQLANISTVQQDNTRKISLFFGSDIMYQSPDQIVKQRHQIIQYMQNQNQINTTQTDGTTSNEVLRDQSNLSDEMNSPISPSKQIGTLQARVNSLEQQLQDTQEQLSFVVQNSARMQKLHDEQIQDLRNQMISFIRLTALKSPAPEPYSSEDESIRQSRQWSHEDLTKKKRISRSFSDIHCEETMEDSNNEDSKEEPIFISPKLNRHGDTGLSSLEILTGGDSSSGSSNTTISEDDTSTADIMIEQNKLCK